MNKTVFAVAAHPDDIEFMMAGTLFLLKQCGCELHYMNVANGDCGTALYDKVSIAGIRLQESVEAASMLGARFHESLTSDLEIFYDKNTLARMTSVMREVKPDILLVQYPFDYMEDHCNACRLAVSAAFCRGMVNAPVDPLRQAVEHDVCVYHAMPYGLHDPMRQQVRPEMFVDIGGVLREKRDMLAKHRSQKEWLDSSQGMDSYLLEMERQAMECGTLSGHFKYAEGWSRRLHLGYCSETADPLGNILKDKVFRAAR